MMKMKLVFLTVISHYVYNITALSIQSKDVTSSSKNNIQNQYFNNQMILAPLTRGGNLPFRRLCTDFGLQTSVSEMIYARSLLRGDPVEQARTRRCASEPYFGVQIATNNAQEGIEAIKELSANSSFKNGATTSLSPPDFIDLNCGCPIYEVTRRGLGSSLLRSPNKLHKLVKGLVEGSDIPITVKIRLGCEADTINCLDNIKAIREAGAAGITIHGRTAQQGYTRNADWDLIKQAVKESEEAGYGHIPIVGNGDILTHYEARRRIDETGVHGVMVGRGALIKPWIFKEFKEDETWAPDIQKRVEIYKTLAMYMQDHFGNDDLGRKKSWNFLPWHFEFLSRYTTPHHEDEYGELSIEKPLIQSRVVPTDDLPPLETLLSNRCTDAHDRIASILWESDSNTDALTKLSQFAESNEFKDILKHGSSTTGEDKVLANSERKGKSGRWEKRRGRKPGPKRTEEEIANIRAERAAKKARILAEGGIWPPSQVKKERRTFELN